MTARRALRLFIAACSTLMFLLWLTAPGVSADPEEPSPPSAASDPAPSVAGLVVYKSAYSVAETVANVQNQLGNVVATVDFAKTASWIERELRPTTLVIGGNLNPGIVAATQKTAIDLPQKYLVWQASGGTVFLGYNLADFLAARIGTDASNPAFEVLRTGSASVASAATGSGTPVSDGSGGPSGTYLVEKTSTTTTVPDAIAQYRDTFAMNNQPTVATVDFSSAASADTPIPPTQLVISDDATVSVPLVAAQQTVAIDLPLRFLAWQDDTGTVHLAHPDIKVIASRHGISGQDTVLDRAAAANNYLTNRVAGTSPS